MADELVRALIRSGTVRVVAAVTSDLLREAARRHDAHGDTVLALGRVATAALLLATHGKDQQRVTLQLHGDGPIGSVTADALAWGGVRMYAHASVGRMAGVDVESSQPGRAHIPARPSTAPALGRHGTVNVIRDLGMRERYRGQAAIVSGEVDEDVAHYLRTSEQIDSAIGCDVFRSADGSYVAAGLLVQALPGAPPETQAFIHEVQTRLRDGALHRALAEGPLGALSLALAVIGEDETLDVLDRRRPRFHCPCSRERVTGMLAMLGRHELANMMAEDRSAEIVCNFCRERYEVAHEELVRIAGSLDGGGTRGEA
jgi:molecular chaperone Hsp33